MLSPAFLEAKFTAAAPYPAYLLSGSPDQQARWAKVHGQIRLTAAQSALIGAFSRRINVLVTSGLWCGDCAHQVPMLDHIARANPAAIDLRFLDRDRHSDLSDQIRICGGNRVPTVLFINEDFDFCGLAGDKTLSRLRAAAAKHLGPACPLPGAELPADEAAATIQDWVDEFERIHLLVRLSTKLRERHGD